MYAQQACVRGCVLPCSGDTGPPVLLIHGFGASAYHWRYTIPELAKTHRVYAIDLLGFGWSDKPLVEYSKYEVWPEQLAAFVKEVGNAPATCPAATCL